MLPDVFQTASPPDSARGNPDANANRTLASTVPGARHPGKRESLEVAAAKWTEWTQWTE